MEYVYLFVERDCPRIKIGYSKCPRGRAGELKQDIDLDASFQIPCKNDNARQIEQLLQLWFSEHSVKIERCNGKTEWFALSALPEVLKFMRKHHVRLRCALPQPVRVPLWKNLKTHPLLKNVPVGTKASTENLYDPDLLARYGEEWLEEKYLTLVAEASRLRDLGVIGKLRLDYNNLSFEYIRLR